MADLTLQEFCPLPPGKSLGEILKAEARMILGEQNPHVASEEKEGEETRHEISPPNPLHWFLKRLRVLASAVQIR
ncbi:MAG: hypothetical protein JXL84_17410 [Deltaproteobacteria bacterium]|nr:hypothetical protein [Deltaproteobacteria bacterium]